MLRAIITDITVPASTPYKQIPQPRKCWWNASLTTSQYQTSFPESRPRRSPKIYPDSLASSLSLLDYPNIVETFSKRRESRGTKIDGRRNEYCEGDAINKESGEKGGRKFREKKRKDADAKPGLILKVKVPPFNYFVFPLYGQKREGQQESLQLALSQIKHNEVGIISNFVGTSRAVSPNSLLLDDKVNLKTPRNASACYIMGLALNWKSDFSCGMSIFLDKIGNSHRELQTRKS
ncbi:hypothetical protein WA026_019882 [Henosepilachna vigintioctopunctata]|uniref:Uncharacterized protein n=1 Tax=Henosepilachna vigintioctopunctata TaxID=420089 RepID=A0AAW1VGG0_9CUCU